MFRFNDLYIQTRKKFSVEVDFLNDKSNWCGCVGKLHSFTIQLTLLQIKMKYLNLIIWSIFVVLLSTDLGFTQNTDSYEGTYQGEIVKSNYEYLPTPKEASVIVTPVGITLMSKYSIYERYAGTYDKTMDGKLGEGEFIVELDKSAHDENGMMTVIIKDLGFTLSITITIREFGKNETLSFRGKKVD